MGTRFIATKEAPVHENVKQAILNATELDTRLVMRPLRNTERVLTNAAVERLLQKEKELGPNIKFEDIIEEVAGVYPKIMRDGTMEAGAWSCGMVVGLIHDIPTCAGTDQRHHGRGREDHHRPPAPVRGMSELLYAVEGGVATITFNRPEKLNALTPEILSALFRRVAEAGADPAVKVIVLTGAGRGFCAGLDLSIIGSGAGGRVETDPGIAPHWGDDVGPEMQRFYSGGWNTLITCRKPTIAAVNGPAFGWGFILALHCDIRFAVEVGAVQRHLRAHRRAGRKGLGVAAQPPRRHGAGGRPALHRPPLRRRGGGAARHRQRRVR